MKMHQSLTTAILILSTGFLAHAQDGSRRGNQVPPPSLLWKSLDKDDDGFLSASEMDAASESLAALDKDNDGKISLSEISERTSRKRGAGPNSGRGNRADNRGARPTEIGAAPGDLGDPGIAWYGRMDLALAEAKRSNRPILFMAAASQCGGVPGVF
jgi:hypothetical protein